MTIKDYTIEELTDKLWDTLVANLVESGEDYDKLNHGGLEISIEAVEEDGQTSVYIYGEGVESDDAFYGLAEIADAFVHGYEGQADVEFEVTEEREIWTRLNGC